MRVAVIGAGISGLAAAYHIRRLSEAAGLPAEITVFEKNPTPGGKIATLKQDGYLLEAGPNGFLDGKKAALELASSLGLEGRLERADRSSARRYIYDGRRLMRLPEGPLKFMTSPVLSAAGKLRIMLEPLVPAKKGGGDESVASFVRRRIGPAALENLVGPMVSGIYAGDPERLSLGSAFPRMAELERDHGGLIRAMLKLRRGGAPAGTLTSFSGGMGTLTGELAAALGERVRTGRRVVSLYRAGDRWKAILSGGEEEFSAVLAAVPAYELSRIFPPAAPFCDNIYYPPLSVVHLGYESGPAAGKADGFGFLATRRAGISILGAVFASNMFAFRTPSGSRLITAMVGGANAPEKALLPDEELVRAAAGDISRVLGIAAGPVFSRVFRYERAIPNYPVGHPGMVAALERELGGCPGLFLAGNAFYGVGVNDAARRALDAAARLVGYLKEKS